MLLWVSVVSIFVSVSGTPLICAFGDAARLISCRMSGLRVTMPVPRGRLITRQCVFTPTCPIHGAWLWATRTNLCRQCFPAPNSFHWTANRPRQSVADRWDFAPTPSCQPEISNTAPCKYCYATYTNCGEDILQFVDKGDQARVVDIDPAMPSAPSLHILTPQHRCISYIDSRVWICARHVCASNVYRTGFQSYRLAQSQVSKAA